MKPLPLQYVKCLLFCRQLLSVRLQQMMQAHCDEAIKLLNSSTSTLSPGLSGSQQVFESSFYLINSNIPNVHDYQHADYAEITLILRETLPIMLVIFDE